jgi:hypothetical protein
VVQAAVLLQTHWLLLRLEHRDRVTLAVNLATMVEVVEEAQVLLAVMLVQVLAQAALVRHQAFQEHLQPMPLVVLVELLVLVMVQAGLQTLAMAVRHLAHQAAHQALAVQGL